MALIELHTEQRPFYDTDIRDTFARIPNVFYKVFF